MEPLFLGLLRQAFENRRSKNTRYSLRAFARSLGLDHGILSLIFAGKRLPSLQHCKTFPARLGLNAADTDAFVRSVNEAKRLRSLNRANQTFSGKGAHAPSPEIKVTPEQFAEISDWYYTSILELTVVEGFQGDPEWVGKSLGISKEEAQIAIGRLLKLGLLIKDGNRLVRAKGHLVTTDRQRTLPTLQKRQAKLLEKSIQSIFSVPIEHRNHSTLTMAIDPDRIPEAKKMIEEFSQSIFQFLKAGKQTQVYELAVLLFPVQIKDNL